MMLVLGAALGFFGGLFGIGGGIIAIPLLALGFGLDQAVAQGTALVMMVPNLLIAWFRYSQRHPVALKTALQIGALACLTTWLVAHFATRLPPDLMRKVFSVFLLAVSLRILKQLQQAPASTHLPDRKARDLRFMPLVGIVGGSSMGLLGVGGGLVATPIFSGWFGQRQTVAQSLSLALVAPSSIIALMTYSGAHRVDWALGLPMALGGLFTVSAGVAVAHRLPEKRMRAAFAWMILCTAAWMLVKPLVLHSA
ncbi:sulfite exporter TauE/SafE family protein [Roseateles koreensis]|uniref:Probable membrane transporter protein n=1 Tax=Roseateles koreensis TaxID=2987526 RepID=A0ABT5KQJ4_9BURK|nr:sulfite exporter TauE/SafE family protein [Roseateles koreensis]MDC8785173.1 sulfite exporter TauE/SafE family protein [Roseateles koreensis]